jgi:hypothetical protein
MKNGPIITTTQSLADFGLPSRTLRSILWPTTTGSRTQRKRTVNALIRFGYNSPPQDLGDELKREFQLKLAQRQRPMVRARHRKTKPHVVTDEMSSYVSPHP